MISFYNIYCSLFHLLFSKKNIFSIIQQYNIGFFWKHFFTVFWFFSKSTPNIFPSVDLVAWIEYFTDCHESRLKRCEAWPRIFCATFRKKLCNTRFIRQDLHWGVVDSKMLLFYRSQIGQCSRYITRSILIYDGHTAAAVFMYVHTCMYVYKFVHIHSCTSTSY